LSLRDIKVPADNSDKQTTDAKSALPPTEFTVVRGASSNTLTIHDGLGPQSRVPTSSYRIYFLPAAFAPTSTGTTATVPSPVVFGSFVRQAGRKVATLVTDVSAPALGALLPFDDVTNFGKPGYYYCVGVNRSGVEAPPEHMVKAP
jgi:hypothetical protein